MDFPAHRNSPSFQKNKLRKLIALCCSNDSKPKLNPYFYMRFRLFGSIILRELNSLLALEIIDQTHPLFNANADSRVFVLRIVSIWVELFVKLKFNFEVNEESSDKLSSDQKIIYELYEQKIQTYKGQFLTLMCTVIAVISRRKNFLDYLEVLNQLIKFFTLCKEFKIGFVSFLKQRGLDLISFLKQIERTPLLEVHNLSLGIFYDLPVDDDQLIKDDPENMLRISIEWLSSEKHYFFNRALLMLDKFLEFHDRKTLKTLFRPHLANIYALIQNKFAMRQKKFSLFETARYHIDQIRTFLKIASKMAFLFYEFLPSNRFSVDVPLDQQIRVFLSNRSSSDLPLETATETRLSLDINDRIQPESPGDDSEGPLFGVELTDFLNRILREGLSISSMGNFYRLFRYMDGRYEMVLRSHKSLVEKLFREVHPLLVHAAKSGITLHLHSKFFFRMFDTYLFLFYCISHRDRPSSSGSANPFLQKEPDSTVLSPKDLFNSFFETLLLDSDSYFEIFQFLFCFAYKDLRLSLHLPLNPVFTKLKVVIFTIFKKFTQDIKYF